MSNEGTVVTTKCLIYVFIFLNEASKNLLFQEEEERNVALTGRHMHFKTYIHPIFRPVTAQYGK